MHSINLFHVFFLITHNLIVVIISDPGVFTSLIESFGVKNVELSELYSLDDDSLSNLVDEFGKVYGLVFLFKWDNSLGVDNKRKPMVGDEMPSDLFFAKQVTHNACATQAILSVLINAPHDESETQSNDDEKGNLILGSMLSSLKNFTSSFPPELKGEAIGASEDIRNAHNSFARKEMFLVDGKSRFATDDDDVFHFIAYGALLNTFYARCYRLNRYWPTYLPNKREINMSFPTSTYI